MAINHKFYISLDITKLVVISISGYSNSKAILKQICVQPHKLLNLLYLGSCFLLASTKGHTSFASGTANFVSLCNNFSDGTNEDIFSKEKSF